MRLRSATQTRAQDCAFRRLYDHQQPRGRARERPHRHFQAGPFVFKADFESQCSAYREALMRAIASSVVQTAFAMNLKFVRAAR